MYKTLLISAAFLGASVLSAAAQSSPSPSTSPSPSAGISAATHCKDKATGQARLKTAASPGAPAGSTTGAAGGSMSGSTTGTGGAAGSAGTTPGGGGSTPSVAASLPDCP